MDFEVMRHQSLASAPLELSEVARLYLDAVDVQVRHIDISRLTASQRQTARVDAGTAVVEFVAATVRRREIALAFADPGKVC